MSVAAFWTVAAFYSDQAKKKQKHKDKPGKTVMNFEGRSRPIKRLNVQRVNRFAPLLSRVCVCMCVCVFVCNKIGKFLKECKNRPNPEDDVFNQ